MRYIGNKENIISHIDAICEKYGVTGNSFFDFFAGTASVGIYYKEKGLQIYSSDIMYLSYCLQKAYIENNDNPEFGILLANIQQKKTENLFRTPLEIVVEYLNDVPDVEGFIYTNYCPTPTMHLEKPRMYFIDEKI
ncbi:MAG: hypothetical protein GX220_02385 [Treponema sp.]|nr:hypothetical protein [Treponema sp.]